jgi:hypothetical protein
MGRAMLTALAVERTHRSGERVLLSDGDGLYLRKQTRDGASWTLRYRFAGREHWLTLGHYPDMSLAQARIEARQARVLLDRRQDPLSVRRAAEAEQRQRGSFRELCEEWYRNEIVSRRSRCPTCGAPRARSSPHSASGARWLSAAWDTRSAASRARTIGTITSRSDVRRSRAGHSFCSRLSAE